jgi:hypothetical protein
MKTYLKKIENRFRNFKLHYKEIFIVLSILFFTVLVNYVNVSPTLIDFVKEDRWAQLLSVFVVSLSLILSFRSTLEIKIEYLINALIITLIFGFLTKPKPKLTKKVEKAVKVVKDDIHKIENNISNKISNN